jgi:hypothetical protein
VLRLLDGFTASTPPWLSVGVTAALSEASVCPRSGPLALNKGIDTPSRFQDPRTSGCKRTPDYLWVVDQLSGECFRPGCHATNLCADCRRADSLLRYEMLVLDALEGDAPTLGLLLTARTWPSREELRRTYDKLGRALRRRWPEFRWYIDKEKQNRGAIHAHALLKGIPTDEESMRLAYEIITRIWCDRHDAIAYPYETREKGPQGLVRLADAGGFIRYLQKELAHSTKNNQALPLGFRGHRVTHSRPRKDGTPGYFSLGTEATRERARASIRERRLAYRLTQLGITGDQAQDVITAELERPRQWAMTEVAYPQSQSRRLDRERQALYKTPAPEGAPKSDSVKPRNRRLGTEEQLPQRAFSGSPARPPGCSRFSPGEGPGTDAEAPT